jgi:transposase
MGRIHTEEFKRKAVRIALTRGLKRRQVASDLGVGHSTLSKWIQVARPTDLQPAADIDLAKTSDPSKAASRHGSAGAYPRSTSLESWQLW